MTRLALAAFVLAACGGDDVGSMPDAAMNQPDASTAKVVALASCPATVAETITDSDTKFVPSAVTISVDGIVKIMTTAEHFVIPNTLTTTDSALMVGRSQTKCFQFKATGTYGIACGVHGFAGTITVN